MRAGLKYLIVGFVIIGFFLAGFGATWIWQRMSARQLSGLGDNNETQDAEVVPSPGFEGKVQPGFRQVSADGNNAVLVGELVGASEEGGKTVMSFKFSDRILRFTIASEFYLRKQRGDAMYPTSDEYETLRLAAGGQVPALGPLTGKTAKLLVYTGQLPQDTAGLSEEAKVLLAEMVQFGDCNRAFGEWIKNAQGEFSGCLPLVAEMYVLEN